MRNACKNRSFSYLNHSVNLHQSINVSRTILFAYIRIQLPYICTTFLHYNLNWKLIRVAWVCYLLDVKRVRSYVSIGDAAIKHVEWIFNLISESLIKITNYCSHSLVSVEPILQQFLVATVKVLIKKSLIVFCQMLFSLFLVLCHFERSRAPILFVLSPPRWQVEINVCSWYSFSFVIRGHKKALARVACNKSNSWNRKKPVQHSWNINRT